MCRVSSTMIQENACPTQVLILSTKSNSFCMLKSCGNRAAERLYSADPVTSLTEIKKNTIRGRRMVLPRARSPSGLLGGRFLAEVVVIGHARADLGVEIPAHRPLGVLFLRFGDLLPHRVLRR